MIRETLSSAIRLAQAKIRWKPGKAESHLAKRIRLEHLPADSTLLTYEDLIRAVLHNPNAQVYMYTSRIMETAFPPDDLVKYLSNPAFTYIGLQGEVLL